ncbi:MAG: DcaP family trimeric outer membrane transporter [Pseudomonadota bacterium]
MIKRFLTLMVAATGVVTVSHALAATDAERISALEEQLKQQQQIMQQQQEMLEAMGAELERLKSSQSSVVVTPTPQATQQPIEPGLAQEPAAPYGSVANAEPATPPSSDKLNVQVYGFAMADAIYDFKRVDPNWEDTLRVSTIPTQNGLFGNDGDMIFSVRQSRLGIKGNYGPDVTFILEGELFGVGGDEGQTTPRLRHAYGTYKNFGMGQTWSNFMDIDIFPNTIDYWGPTGMVFYRNQQARYTFPMGKNEFSVSLEDPGTALTVGRFRDTSACDLPDPPPDCESTGSTASELFQAYNNLPDLTARYRLNGDFGHYQIAGIVRDLGVERIDTGNKITKTGWGINNSAGIKTWGRDQLKLQVVYGKGIGNYMNDGGVDIAPSSGDPETAQAETLPLLGISAYYDHYWNEKWSTSFGWSMTDLDTRDGQGPDEFKKGQIAQINLLHYPLPYLLLGGEFSWGEREDVDGETGTDYRVQFSLKVNFDTGDLLRGD